MAAAAVAAVRGGIAERGGIYMISAWLVGWLADAVRLILGPRGLLRKLTTKTKQRASWGFFSLLRGQARERDRPMRSVQIHEAASLQEPLGAGNVLQVHRRYNPVQHHMRDGGMMKVVCCSRGRFVVIGRPREFFLFFFFPL